MAQNTLFLAEKLSPISKPRLRDYIIDVQTKHQMPEVFITLAQS